MWAHSIISVAIL
ncbi:putative membrane protein, partial [Chlamydia psittaci 84-8471/1]